MGCMAQIYPLQLLIASLAGLLNRQQAEVLEYLIEENRVLKEQLQGKRLRLTDDQRRRLAAKGKRIGRRLLTKVATIVSPDTILRWHRELVARKWDYSDRREKKPGRPRVRQVMGSSRRPSASALDARSSFFMSVPLLFDPSPHGTVILPPVIPDRQPTL